MAAGTIIPALVGLLTFLGLGDADGEDATAPANSSEPIQSPGGGERDDSAPPMGSPPIQTPDGSGIAVAIASWTVEHPSPKVERYAVEGSFQGVLGFLSEIVVGARLANEVEWSYSGPAVTSGTDWQARIEIRNPAKESVHLRAFVISSVPALPTGNCPPTCPQGRIDAKSPVIVITR
jgi:hypothetical protein